ncbi:MAG: exo-alpha-sialidase [Pseudomonadales bacterium]|jgi:predicted neuraminidase|tara:strand:+ start:3945 stop:5078 length:1134 start_codon:yes stop_codon:yes gene_type:complete
MNPALKITLIIASAAVFFGCWTLLIPARQAPAYLPPAVIPAHQAGPVFEAHWVSNNETNEAHSASIAIVEGKPVAVWYGGTEEGHRDVAIFSSSFDGKWSAPRIIADRNTTEQALNRYIRKVGNPNLYAWPDGRLGLYYVSVSVGGWAASSINYMESFDQGMQWSSPIRLVTSPFLNISTLVRTEGLPLSDGGVQLPVYHEFLGKFSETVTLSSDLAVMDKVRISRGKHSLQPAIINLDEFSAVGLLRYSGDPPGRVLSVFSQDAGAHWSTPVKTELPNPNSAVSIINPGNGYLLVALNDLEDGRHRLSLAMGSADEWKIVKVLEEETATNLDHQYEFSYPSMTIGPDGFIHLVYTWNQRRIKHLRFNREWLELPET